MDAYKRLVMGIHIIHTAGTVGCTVLSLNLAGLFLLFQHLESQSVKLVAVCQLPTKHRPDGILTGPLEPGFPSQLQPACHCHKEQTSITESERNVGSLMVCASEPSLHAAPYT